MTDSMVPPEVEFRSSSQDLSLLNSNPDDPMNGIITTTTDDVGVADAESVSEGCGAVVAAPVEGNKICLSDDSLEQKDESLSSTGSDEKSTSDITSSQNMEVEAIAKEKSTNNDTSSQHKKSSSSSEVKEGSSVGSEMGKVEDQGEDDLISKYMDLLRFVATSEELKRAPKGCFVKEYNGDVEEWKNNHFFQNPSKPPTEIETSRTNKPTAAINIPPAEDRAKMTVPQLRELCKSKSLKATTSMKRQELLDALANRFDPTGNIIPNETSDQTASTDSHDDPFENKTKDANRVWLNSYDYSVLRSYNDRSTENEKNTSNDISGPWLTVPFPKCEKPSLEQFDSDPAVRLYLKQIKMDDPSRFENCGDELDDILPLLLAKDMPSDNVPETRKVRDFILSVVEYFQWTDPMMRLYNDLFKRSTSKSSRPELLLGFGHIRMVVTTSKNGKQHESKLVNGPLFCVPVEAKLQNETGASDIIVTPKVNSQISLNMEILSAITSDGQSNRLFLNKLLDFARKTSVSSLHPNESLSFKALLERAILLRSGGIFRSVNNDDVHSPPQSLRRLVLTDAWCLFSREHKTTSFSDDARNLLSALHARKIGITEPIRGLLSGPKYFERNCNIEHSHSKELMYPLPASNNQKEACIRLLAKNHPVVNLQGPPGTGKTHTIVNIAATALSENKTVVIGSSNPRALKAFVDKLPKKLQTLVLDLSCIEELGITQFQSSLELLTRSLQRADAKRGEDELKGLENIIAKKQAMLTAIDQNCLERTEKSRHLFENESLGDAYIQAANLSTKAPWLVKAVFAQKISDLASTTAFFQEHDITNVSYDTTDKDYVKDDCIEHVQKLVQKAETRESVLFEPEEGSKLSLIRVNGQIPTKQKHWKAVESALLFRKSLVLPLLECASADHIFNDDGTIRSDFPELINEACRLERLWNDVKDDEKKAVLGALETDLFSQSQNDYRELTEEIQKMQAELVFIRVVVSLKKKLGADALMTLKSMGQSLKKLNSAALASGNDLSARGSRHFEAFTSLFKDAAKFMPFLVMTIEQISIYLPPEHTCDIGIIDESSQSTCTAITFMARCKQMLIVGDDKQVSPSQCFLSEDLIHGLEQSLPDISAAEQLKPESSFFDLCIVAFPYSEVSLYEHYRCHPDIIAISNEKFYLGELVPLRLRSHTTPAVIDKKVDGKRDPKKKTNQIEAEAVAEYVYDEIKSTANKQDFKTIAVISLGTAEQHKLIKNLVDAKLDKLISEHGSNIVDRHDILYGTSSDCQGAERDIVYLTACYSPNEKANSKLVEDKNWKGLNVAITRAKDKMYLFRSFGLKDLHNRDPRSDIFRAFINAGMSHASTVNERMLLEPSPLVESLEDKIAKGLEENRYRVSKNGGAIWPEALLIESTDDSKCALLHIENAGESTDKWKNMFDQQLSLERAGRCCLRVDCLNLVLDFRSTFETLLSFLQKSGLTNSGKRGATPVAAAAAADGDESDEDIAEPDAKKTKVDEQFGG